MNRHPSIDNVVPLRPVPAPAEPRDPFQQLTAQLVLAQFRAGTLPEPVMLFLLAGAGLRP